MFAMYAAIPITPKKATPTPIYPRELNLPIYLTIGFALYAALINPTLPSFNKKVLNLFCRRRKNALASKHFCFWNKIQKSP
jgi:hypothetical protein